MRRSSRPAPRRRPARGFTLVELIVAMVIISILTGMIALFVRWPVQAYVDAKHRAVLSDAADIALRRLGREIRQALPNSLRIASGACTSGGGNCYFIEFIPIKAGGRYRASKESVGGSTQPLDLEATGNQSFDLIGPPLCPATECTVAAGDSVVIYNQGSGNSNAYLDPAANNEANRRLVRNSSLGNNLTRLDIGGTTRGLCRSLPAPYYDGSNCAPDDSSVTPHYYELPGFRYYLIGGAVTYECPVAAGAGASAIRRHAGYGLAAAQPTSFGGGTTTLLGSQIDRCLVKLTTDSRLLVIGLDLTANGETIHLLHQIDVYNAP